jgi:putative FmdB family regulatory protein
MPIYEYVCEGCGAEAEVLQRRDDPPPACDRDECGEGTMVRVLSAHVVGAASFGSNPLPAHCPSAGACSSCPSGGPACD